MNKISYLKGLLDGLQVHPESREGKIFYAVCEALEETAGYAERLEARVAELEELCDILDEDLGLVEEMVEDTACSCNSCDSKLMAYDRPERYTPDKSSQVNSVNPEEPDDTDDSETVPEIEQIGETLAEQVLSQVLEELSASEDTEENSESDFDADFETATETRPEEENPEKNPEQDTESFLEDGEEEYETTCPTCGECILLTEQMLEEGETVCPNCGEELEFDFDEEEIERLAPAEDE